MGLDFPYGRGRYGLWFDWNKDGLLDLLQVNDSRTDDLGQTTLFEQKVDGTFLDANAKASFDVKEAAISAQVTDLFGDGTLDLLVFSDVRTGSGILKVYQTPLAHNQAPSLVNITNKLPVISNIRDAAIADFNGDLVPDIFLARSNEYIFRSNIWQSTPSLAVVKLSFPSDINQGEKGVTFKTIDNTVTFNFADLYNLSNKNIFIGSGGYIPSSNNFSLSINDSNVQGIVPPANRNKNGLYIGYDAISKTWQAIYVIGIFSNPTPQQIDLIIDTDTSLTNFTPIDFALPNIEQLESIAPILLSSNVQTGQYKDNTLSAGLSTPISSQSVVYGDFDNDMDLDLYLTSVSVLGVRQSIYYANQGDGTFVRDINVAGALIKITGQRFEDFHNGLNVSTGDYNRDGFLDLFVGSSTLNGNGMKYQGSPYHLFKNQGNNNHWLEIDLEGTQSNQDAIGTKVYVVSGGVTQLREQNGGVHRMSQNEQILHFGLASNNQVDSIIIKWASGIEQQFDNIASDQLIQYLEPNATNFPTDNNDNLLGSLGDDFIDALAGNDTINGQSSNDTLLGNDGNDSLSGGVGNDSLVGGAGNDIYVVDNLNELVQENLNNGNDTIQSSISLNLSNYTNIENLTLVGTPNIDATGNTGNNQLIGNTGINQLNGGAGVDTLTGGSGSDIYIYQFGQSLVSAPDRITDFAFGSDKIDLLGNTSNALNAPISLTRANDSIETSLSNLVNQVFIDANAATAGNQALGTNSASLIKVTTGAIAGTYLIINNFTAGFQSNQDSVVNITGYTGIFANLGSNAVKSLFI